ncbi:MAG: hypothetical protein MMC23_008901, partial [Stictis urceolatum]|nr:hypothetical protein [Stictis urceolata]
NCRDHGRLILLLHASSYEAPSAAHDELSTTIEVLIAVSYIHQVRPAKKQKQ